MLAERAAPADSYAHPPADRMQAFAARAVMTEGEGIETSSARIHGRDLMAPGDEMTIWIEPATVAGRRVEIAASAKDITSRGGVTVAQRTVESLIGRLITDEQFRRDFLADPEGTLRSFRDRGFELTSTEMAALVDTDRGLWERAADEIDPRLQKASLVPRASDCMLFMLVAVGMQLLAYAGTTWVQPR